MARVMPVIDESHAAGQEQDHDHRDEAEDAKPLAGGAAAGSSSSPGRWLRPGCHRRWFQFRFRDGRWLARRVLAGSLICRFRKRFRRRLWRRALLGLGKRNGLFARILGGSPPGRNRLGWRLLSWDLLRPTSPPRRPLLPDSLNSALGEHDLLGPRPLPL